jgi:ppGpp synthetase/RelA/SpoT-type nucleotidyltranferase
MPLPISKTALDKLGSRLAAEVTTQDLATLHAVAGIYQAVLGSVKNQLTALGYPATTRIKTTSTLVEKLRRESVRLSQVQDLAGARIIVSHRVIQDEALDRISQYFVAQGDRCKEHDRRASPSHGYRAVHLIVTVDDIPVEIQIRTELEDTWAQILERLGDAWGRGIRYGQPPDNPETNISAGSQMLSRHEALRFLLDLSDAIATFELTRATMLVQAQMHPLFTRFMTYVGQFEEAQDQRPVADLPADEQALLNAVKAGLAAAPVPAIQEALAEPATMSVAALISLFRQSLDAVGAEISAMLPKLSDREQELRDRLQLIASATAEGE